MHLFDVCVKLYLFIKEIHACNRLFVKIQTESNFDQYSIMNSNHYAAQNLISKLPNMLIVQVFYRLRYSLYQYRSYFRSTFHYVIKCYLQLNQMKMTYPNISGNI